eukprot:s459_g12.t1
MLVLSRRRCAAAADFCVFFSPLAKPPHYLDLLALLTRGHMKLKARSWPHSSSGKSIRSSNRHRHPHRWKPEVRLRRIGTPGIADIDADIAPIPSDADLQSSEWKLRCPGWVTAASSICQLL